MKIRELLFENNDICNNKNVIEQVLHFVNNIELDMNDYEDIKSYETKVPYGDTYSTIIEYEDDDIFKAKKKKAYDMLLTDIPSSTFDYIDNIEMYYPDDETDESFNKIKSNVLGIIENL